MTNRSLDCGGNEASLHDSCALMTSIPSIKKTILPRVITVIKTFFFFQDIVVEISFNVISLCYRIFQNFRLTVSVTISALNQVGQPPPFYFD